MFGTIPFDQQEELERSLSNKIIGACRVRACHGFKRVLWPILRVLSDGRGLGCWMQRIIIGLSFYVVLCTLPL